MKCLGSSHRKQPGRQGLGSVGSTEGLGAARAAFAGGRDWSSADDDDDSLSDQCIGGCLGRAAPNPARDVVARGATSTLDDTLTRGAAICTVWKHSGQMLGPRGV